ncbi:hypothetical protein FJR06_12270 [Dolichospermum sp. UHCC 0352]|nr:hypothetical protein [Dolichospermum sp. UHCC 0299]MTJ22042.1 hypothetical protein [Dolichospermum sp. UHCC 0352]MTJ37603.1 hypothetical protein [Dolichospermum sp. UHCC 0406]
MLNFSLSKTFQTSSEKRITTAILPQFSLISLILLVKVIFCLILNNKNLYLLLPNYLVIFFLAFFHFFSKPYLEIGIPRTHRRFLGRIDGTYGLIGNRSPTS